MAGLRKDAVVIDWKIFYSDLSSFSSEDGSPLDAPARDAQVVLVRKNDPWVYPDGRAIYHGRDGWFTGYYHWHDEWVPHDLPGLLDCLGIDHQSAVSLSFLEASCVKIGRTIPDDQFFSVLEKALRDEDIPSCS